MVLLLVKGEMLENPKVSRLFNPSRPHQPSLSLSLSLLPFFLAAMIEVGEVGGYGTLRSITAPQGHLSLLGSPPPPPPPLNSPTC